MKLNKEVAQWEHERGNVMVKIKSQSDASPGFPLSSLYIVTVWKEPVNWVHTSQRELAEHPFPPVQTIAFFIQKR